MNNLRFIRVPVALMWIYEGLWCKILGFAPRQAAVVGSVPFLSLISAHRVLIGIGLFECVIAIWILSGWQAVRAAIVQIALLVGMNGCGLLWARNFIPDPIGMVIQNLTFVTLILIATGEVPIARQRD